ncbi:MAG: SLBB domain-containing protein [Thermodesulfovibrionales bacterium]|nr:SLBB domain-containing protein [Thermodesulfovibrionales bacterium]
MNVLAKKVALPVCRTLDAVQATSHWIKKGQKICLKDGSKVQRLDNIFEQMSTYLGRFHCNIFNHASIGGIYMIKPIRLTSYASHFTSHILALLFMLIFSGSAFSQQIETIPITPQYLAPAGPTLSTQPSIQVQQPILQQLQPQPALPTPPQQPLIPVQPSVEKPSAFEQYIAGKLPLTVSTDLKHFGYDLFRQPPSTFAPVDNIPVGPDYVLGPGDEIRITVWGKIEGQWSVVVNRDGNISLPKVGILGVTGLTFKELKELLHKEFSKYYTGFEMNVSMGPLRTIRVYVVGNAERPGAYTVSSLSTLVNALFEAGGPSKTGTMREIQVKRNGKTIVHFDIYDFLLKGDKTKDIRLMPEDVIFIPHVGALVGIAGNVRNPAIYELKGELRLFDLIQMAGGLTSVAFKGRVQVQRTEDHQFRTIFEGDLIEIEKNPEKNFALKDGDLVKVFSIVETKNTVIITGAVANPGEYGITPGVTKVRDVISLSGGLLYYASNQAEITRIKVTQAGPRTERLFIDLSKALEGDHQHNVPLEINDYLFVRTVPEWELYRTVTISGEVKFPGTYTIKKGEKLSSLIERAGGYTDNAYLRGAVFTRERVRELQQRQLDEMVERLERELLGRGAAETAAALSPEEAKIKEYEIKQKRDFVAALKGVKAKGRMAIKIDQPEILKKTPYDVELEKDDSLFIPSNPQSVQIIGSVYNQTAFVYDKDKGYSRYIDLAGGYTENADKKRVYILKADGTAVRPGGGFLGISWSKDSNRWEIGGQELDPGDTIVVPEKIERIAWMREIRDLTQILYQIAVTAGVLIVAF